MQKFFLMIFMCVIAFSNYAQAMTTTEYISKVEEELFGISYENQTVESRIDRIEHQIYDNIYSGTPEERLVKIEKIYPIEDFEIQQQSNNQFPEYYEEEYIDEPKAYYNNYPIVSKIEQSVYQKDFSGEDIYTRLARLEKKLYGQENNNLSLQERVENLKEVLPKRERISVANALDDFSVNDGYYDAPSILNQLEKESFSKTFDNDDAEKRLSRLENFYFGQTSKGQSLDDRLTRLASVVMSESNSNEYSGIDKKAQWAEILLNILVVGLGFLL